MKGVFSPFAQRWSCQGQLRSACVQLLVGFNPSKLLSTKSCCFSLGKANIAEETQQPLPTAQTDQEALEVISGLNDLEEANSVPGGYDHHPHTSLPCNS